MNRKDIIKMTELDEVVVDFEKLATDLGADLSRLTISGMMSVEGGLELIVAGRELDTTFYHISVMNDSGSILLFQNNIFGNSAYQHFRFDTDDDTDKEFESMMEDLPIARIEAGVDVENFDKCLIRTADGRILPLENYTRHEVEARFDTSLFRVGDIVRFTIVREKGWKRDQLCEYRNAIGMIESFSETFIGIQTRNTESESIHHLRFPITALLSGSFREFEIEKVDIK